MSSPDLIVVSKPKAKPLKRDDAYWEQLFDAAELAGARAAASCSPTPAICCGSYESEGLCGFAWVDLPDARSSFARWIRKHRPDRYGSVFKYRIHARIRGQSLDREMSYAAAFAEVLRSAGIDCETGWCYD